MKNKRIFKTLSALCAALVLMGGFSVTAFAQGPEQPPAEDATNDTNVVKETEDSPALTPEGNAALVDDFGGNKQLITITTKSGNYFYILIDRANEDKETAVHFLNQVDEADLMALMDKDEQKAYTDSLALKTSESVNAATAESTEESVTEAVSTKTEKSANNEQKSSGGTPAAVIAILILLVTGGYFGYKILKENGQKKPVTNPDPDADYSEDNEDYLRTLNEKDDTGFEDLEKNTEDDAADPDENMDNSDETKDTVNPE